MARGLRALLLVSLMGVSLACSAGAVPAHEPSPPRSIPIEEPEKYSGDAHVARGQKPEGLDDICKIDPAACPSLDTEKGAARELSEPLYNVVQTYGYEAGGDPIAEVTGTIKRYAERDTRGSRSTSAQAPQAIPTKAASAARPELFDIEARVGIQVSDIEKARARVAELTEGAGGQVMNEAVEKGADVFGASLSLRVPSEKVHALLARLVEVGAIRSSHVETNEVSRTIADAEVLERNLEQTLRRYEELLAKASNVTETIQVEAQLARVRTALDRVRGDLEWTKDRVARSTVYVTLSREAATKPHEARAKLHPGLRAVLFYDVLPASASEPSTAYAGGGVSIAWPRTFNVDLDLLTSLREARDNAIDFYVVTLGKELYSDFLGGGERSSLNPYIGLRTGFAHAPRQSLWPLGVTLGLDLYKSEAVLFAFEARTYALIGRKEGVDLGLEPALGLNVAY